MIDFHNMAEVKRLITYAKAEHITLRLLDVLDDYYRDSDVEIFEEIDLPGLMTSEIQCCLNELKG